MSDGVRARKWRCALEDAQNTGAPSTRYCDATPQADSTTASARSVRRAMLQRAVLENREDREQ